jgi:hypothetical protein
MIGETTMSDKLEKAIQKRIEEWESHYSDARYFGDSHYVQRCDSILTILKNILAEA